MKLSLVALVLLIACVPAIHAKTVEIPGEHFSIDIPDDWRETTKPGILYSAADESNTSAVAILKFTNNQNHVVDADYLKDVKQGMVDQGPQIGAKVEIEGEGPLTIHGVPAYFVLAKTTLPNSQVVHQRLYPIAANGNIYALSVQSTDPGKAAELQTIANSQKSDSAPLLPDPMRGTLSYKIGYVIGTLLFLLAAYLFIKWVVKLIKRGSA